MVYKLIVSKEAHHDIDEIVGYMISELMNAQAAKSFIDDLEKSYHSVVGNPLMYSLCSDKRLQKEGYRKIVIKNYLVLYRIDEARKCVFIVRVIYGARDYSQLI